MIFIGSKGSARKSVVGLIGISNIHKNVYLMAVTFIDKHGLRGFV